MRKSWSTTFAHVCFTLMLVSLPVFGCSSDPTRVDQSRCTVNATTTKGTQRWDWYQVFDQEVLNAVASGPDGYRIAGNGSLTKRSRDGLHWRTISLGGATDLLAMVSIGDAFVAVGDGFYSTYMSPTVFASSETGQTQPLRSIAWSGALAVALGDNGELLTTPDGRTWTRHTQFTDKDVNAVTWTGQVFVAGGEDGDVFSSADGTLWLSEETPFSQTLKGLTFHNGTLVGVTKSGEIWVKLLNGEWILRGDTGGRALNGVAWGADAFVAVGDDATVLVSSDGRCWDQFEVMVETDFRSVSGGDRIVAVGTNSAVVVSDDVRSWEIRPSSPPYDIEDIAWNGATYIAVGGEGAFRSNDGQSWSGILGAPWKLRSVTWTGIQFVAVGSDGVVLVSSNGANWTSESPGNDADLWTVFWTGNKLLVGGDSGLMLSSLDGASWTEQSLDLFGAIFGIAASAESIVAVTSLGYVAVTDDGENWVTDRITGSFSDLVWFNGQFIATSVGWIHVSSDGRSWQGYPVGTTHYLGGIGVHNQRVYVVGANGEVFSSNDAMSWTQEVTGLSELDRVGPFLLNSVLSTRDGVLVGGDNGIVLRHNDG
jgi:hypothetical protein